jgi:lysophospholipase L1-like esterase
MMRPFLPLLAALLLSLTLACGSDSDDNAAGTDPTRTTSARTPSPTRAARTSTPSPGASIADTSDPNAPLYIALGDSLSHGAGASNRATTAFVPLVHDGLGAAVGLLNLGHSGDDSFEITRHGHLDQAVGIIERRNGDTNPNNDVVLVTLEIGGNDLLDIYFDLVVPGTCPNVEEGLRKPVCVNAIERAFDAFTPNLRGILAALREADPDLRIALMTLYNPFSGSAITAFEPIGELALEGTPGTQFPEGLNDIIRAEGTADGATIVDIYPQFVGKGSEYIALDLIHPNDAGYRVIADAVLATIGN